MTVSTDQRLATDAGSAPATGDSASPAAWHPDPVGRFPLRYWDGTTWTANVVNGERQVGIDRGWAEAMAAAATHSSAAPPSAAPTQPAPDPPTPPSATPSPAPVAAEPATPPVPASAPSLDATSPEATPPSDPDTPGPGPTVDAPPSEPQPRRSEATDEAPVERFDISPAAVMGPRAARRTPPPHEPDAVAPAHQAPVARAEASGPPGAPAAPPRARRWARSGAPRDPRPIADARAGTGTSTCGPEEGEARGPGLLTRIGGVKVLAVAGVALVVLAVGLGLAWASAGRSYDAQEAWQRRAQQWEERAGDHANERDEAIARIGRSRGRNRELNEENAEQQRQIEDLAADNAALTDENRLLNDALNSLGYELAP